MMSVAHSQQTSATTTRTFKVTRAGNASLLTWEETEAELQRVIDGLALPTHSRERRPGRRGGSFSTGFDGADHLFRYIRSIVRSGNYYRIAGVAFEEVKAAPAPAFRELIVEMDEDAGGEWNNWEI